MASSLMHQCSRATLGPVEGTWHPTWDDVAAFEAALPGALGADPRGRELLNRHAPQGWLRQYGGLVRGGRRFVYGNYFPREAGLGHWRDRVVIVCDGGLNFFGAEYDVKARRITHLDFNGGF
jgi:hypothetical protein